ncbi:2-oxoglutarate dehydrogenase complex E2 component [Brettanomyces nanus]|uniref:dihydrolipoyllysine-residue succinyltransferase n=1 Tax=Eeniella nana TaxID=13502 RepID=A0A875S6Q4_EENNA|nr:2-oxoglutarate dehydrogenase complex E2 component [Brettanomyces nanus]QPG76628.1 2-oxoglutarate dehydrogenase complex E2 component [Brettanomyces nanus]
MLRSSVKYSVRRVQCAAKGSLSLSVATPASIKVACRSIQTFAGSSGITSYLIRPSIVSSHTSRPNFLSSQLFARGKATVIKVPEMAESITEGTLASFSKNVGDYVAQDELLATIETDKIDVEVNAPVGGIVTELLANPGEDVSVGQDLAKIEPGEAPEAPRITSPFGKFSRGEEKIKMNRMRKRIAERLKEAQNSAASLTTFNEVDMSSVMEMRKLYKDEFIKKTGIKMGFMGPFSKACTLAAKDYPAVGAAIENNDTMVYRDYMDISIAVSTPKGLVTPVIRNAESLSVLDIEAEIVKLSHKARDGKLSLEDLAGGTFTISNGGIFGSLYGTPIINSPQTAVLGLHGIKQRPVTVNGNIESRPMMYIALTYDHRMLDGREAVSFLRTVKELMEDPRKMLLM